MNEFETILSQIDGVERLEDLLDIITQEELLSLSKEDIGVVLSRVKEKV